MIKNYSYTSRHNKENDVINLSKTIRKKTVNIKARREGNTGIKSNHSFIHLFFLNLKLKNECKIGGNKSPCSLGSGDLSQNYGIQPTEMERA